MECLIATQSPKDIDYKAFEQFNTIASGRISSEQSLKVLERILEPIAGEKQSEEIIRALPGQETATFIFSSAEMKPKVNHIGVRWLLTRHITLTEKDVQKHMSELVKQQQKILQEMERVRLADKAKKEGERRRLSEQRKKDAEQRRLDEERRKKE